MELEVFNLRGYKINCFLAFQSTVPFLCCQFINKLKSLSRKAEGLDPMKPWQPFIFKEGATFYLDPEFVSGPFEKKGLGR